MEATSLHRRDHGGRCGVAGDHRVGGLHRAAGAAACVLVDADACSFGVGCQRPDPAGRLERAVVVHEAAGVPDAPQRRLELVAPHIVRREAVLAERRDVRAHVLGFLVRCGEPQRTDAPHGFAHAELVRKLVHLPLRLHRARVKAPRRLAAPAPARVHVEGRRARQQEAAVAPARP